MEFSRMTLFTFVGVQRMESAAITSFHHFLVRDTMPSDSDTQDQKFRSYLKIKFRAT